MHGLKRDLVLRIGLGGGALAAIIGLTIATGADMGARAERIASLRENLVIRASSVERLVRLRSDADRAVPYRNALGELLPKPEELVGFPREVRTEATAQGVTVANISLGAETPPTTTGDPGSIDVQFSVTGTLPAFAAFLQALEERAGFITFSSIDAPVTTRVNAAVKAKVFTR